MKAVTNRTDVKCYICRSTNLETSNLNLPAGGQMSLIICRDCGYARRKNIQTFTENLDTQVNIFDHRQYNRFYPVRWPHRYKLLASEIHRLAGMKGNVLDIGCGMGKWLSCLGPGWRKHGVELSPKTAELARVCTDADIFCGPIEQYSAEPDYFDLITAFALIEHLTEPHYLIQWAYKHLKKGGLLVIMTGDRESEVAIKAGPSWPQYCPIAHVSFFSSRSLCHLLKREGFDIVRQEWRFMSYSPSSLLSRYIAKTKEILRLVQKPCYDHYYVYCRKA